MLGPFGNMRNKSHQVAALNVNSARVCSNQIYSDSSCAKTHECEQERNTELRAAQCTRCERQRSRWRTLHAMATTTGLVAVGGCLDAVDGNNFASGAYRIANARGGIERTANVGACETRALGGIRAVAVPVGTTAGRARAGRCAAGALDAIRITAVPALQATGLADWAALHLQGHDFDLGMRLLQAFVQASCRFLTLHLPSLSSGETHFIFRNKFCSYTATSTFTGVAVFSVGSAGEFRITLVTAAILQEMAQWAIGYIINTTGFNF